MQNNMLLTQRKSTRTDSNKKYISNYISKKSYEKFEIAISIYD
jgi:hypothetical protein